MIKKIFLILNIVSLSQINGMNQASTKKQKISHNNSEVKKEVEAKITADQKLHLATKENNIGDIKSALKEGACINSKDENGDTCLIWAATIGNLQMTKFLIENGADMGIKKSQVTFSFYRKDLDKYTFDEEYLTPLMIAAQNNYIELTRFLAKNCKFPIEIINSIAIAEKHNRQKIKSILCRQRYLNNTLIEAVCKDKFDEVKKALENGANAKYHSETNDLNSLHEALESESDINIVKMLLKHDQSLINQICDRKTPLFKALLLDFRNKATAIFHNGNEPSIIQLLIDNGADINISGDIFVDEEEYPIKISPLMLAALNNRIDIVTTLIWNGADLNFKDFQGHTALELIQYISRGFTSPEKIIIDKYAVVLFVLNPDTLAFDSKDFKEMHIILQNAEKMKKISREKIVTAIISATHLIKDLSELTAQYLI